MRVAYRGARWCDGLATREWITPRPLHDEADTVAGEVAGGRHTALISGRGPAKWWCRIGRGERTPWQKSERTK